jgi:hypothetical protein
MNQDNTEEEEVTPAVEATDAELGALGSSLAASSAGSLAGGAFGSPGGPAAGAVLLGLLTGQEELPAEVNPPSHHEDKA